MWQNSGQSSLICYIFLFQHLCSHVNDLLDNVTFLLLTCNIPIPSWYNDLLFNEFVDDVVKEVGIKEALKSSIFVVQKAAAPKNGVEFCQRSIGAIRHSLATSYDGPS